ncbi:MAG: hypothetical protein AABX14_03735 [Candidatus Aenigmatarchaeota archaeon]
MITLRMNIKRGNVELGQRYLATTGILSGATLSVSEFYGKVCLLTEDDRGPRVIPRYISYRFTEDSFIGSRKGGRDTTADSLVLLNGRA